MPEELESGSDSPKKLDMSSPDEGLSEPFGRRHNQKLPTRLQAWAQTVALSTPEEFGDKIQLGDTFRCTYCDQVVTETLHGANSILKEPLS